jgi:hypothetical protein
MILPWIVQLLGFGLDPGAVGEARGLALMSLFLEERMVSSVSTARRGG